MTTTILRIDFMLRAIGINELTSHSATPTTIITSKIVNIDITVILMVIYFIV